MSKRTLENARIAKDDEFYTKYEDIVNEMSFYTSELRDKTIYCNCDDPKFSQFWAYFHDNFHSLGIKHLIATYFDCYNPVLRYDYDGVSIKKERLDFGFGDFSSLDCEMILDEADIVISNPPFSKFTDYVSLLLSHNCKFIILGSNLASTYSVIVDSIISGVVRSTYPLDSSGKCSSPEMHFTRPDGSDAKVACCWYSNVQSTKPYNKLSLLDYYDIEQYQRYDNMYDCIEVPDLKSIPCYYNGKFGIPVTILNSYDLSEYEILEIDKHLRINDKQVFNRVIMRRKQPKLSCSLSDVFHNFLNNVR